LSIEALTIYIGASGDGINLSPEEKKLLVAYKSTGRSYEVINFPIPKRSCK